VYSKFKKELLILSFYCVYFNSQKEITDASESSLYRKQSQQMSLGYAMDTIVLINLKLIHVFFIQKDISLFFFSKIFPSTWRVSFLGKGNLVVLEKAI
jgi:hypothetical protein